jgi:hypothetical protein
MWSSFNLHLDQLFNKEFLDKVEDVKMEEKVQLETTGQWLVGLVQAANRAGKV